MTAMPVRKYNPGFLSDDELVASFCVRMHEFESLIEALRGCTGDSNQHQVVIGPRGSGKTSLLLRVAAELRRDADLAASFFPIVFAEESYEVGTAGEFWLECLARLAIQAPQQEDAPDLIATLADLRTIHDDQTLGERCLATLLDFADREGKRLVLMVENLNMMFSDMIDRDAGWRLRKVLQTEPRLILLASATSRFNEIDHPEHALYDQFRVLTLRPLTTDECAVLWRAVAQQNRPTTTIRSLEILTGGSPRLLAIVARFGAGLSFRDLMDSLFDLVDDHTEYFKSHLESLPAQERRVYLALADLWKPALTKEVAERARLETSKCSAQLARLIERGVVRVEGGSARRRQYYLSERMYNIYYLLRRGKERLVEVLIRFMAFFYSSNELKEIGTRTAREAEAAGPEMRTLYQYVSAELIAMSTQDPAGKKWHTTSDMGSVDDIARLLLHKGEELWESNRLAEALATYDELLTRLQETQGPALLESVALVNKGVILGALGKQEQELAVYDEVLRRFGESRLPEYHKQVAKALINRGATLGALNRPEEALDACEEVLLRFDDGDRSELLEELANALVNKGAALVVLNRPEEALAACDEALRRVDGIEAPELDEQVASALVNRGNALGALSRHEEELDAYEQVLRRFDDSDVPELLAQVRVALYNRGITLSTLNRMEEALATYDEVLRRSNDKETPELLEQIAKTLVNKGAVLGALDRREEALAIYDQVRQRFKDSEASALLEQVANALVNKSIVLIELNRITERRDVAALLAVLPELNAPEIAIRVLMVSSVDHGPQWMCELIQASRVAAFLLPLTTALERDMGLDPRVPEEISEVAEDIRKTMAEMKEVRRT